jgi:hypothetical protein
MKIHLNEYVVSRLRISTIGTTLGSVCFPHWSADVEDSETRQKIKSINKVCQYKWCRDTKLFYGRHKGIITKWEEDFYVNVKVNKSSKLSFKQADRLKIIEKKCEDSIRVMTKAEKKERIYSGPNGQWA